MRFALVKRQGDFNLVAYLLSGVWRVDVPVLSLWRVDVPVLSLACGCARVVVVACGRARGVVSQQTERAPSELLARQVHLP